MLKKTALLVDEGFPNPNESVNLLLSVIAELMPRMEGELSSVLGVLATGRNQGRLEGFTINMTSLDDIFLEVSNFNLFDSIQVLFMTSVDYVTKSKK